MTTNFKILAADELCGAQRRPPVDSDTLVGAAEIVDRVREQGLEAIRHYGAKFGERTSDEPILLSTSELASAFARLPDEDQELLARVAARIESFAQSQLDCLSTLDRAVPGGRAGHTIEPVERVGCYAPGGRYPLPSTVLMTAVTAKVAGCPSVVLASPNPTDLTLAAAHVAGVQQMLAIGGAHAIAAMAYGFDGFERCDLLAGPGNRWVTAAKQLVVGSVGIDMLAGPSELVIVADDSAHPETVAADLLAQAEHDNDARPFLICWSQQFATQVEQCLESLLQQLSTRETASIALGNGAAIVVSQRSEALRICNELAPEHLELHLENAEEFAASVKHAGCVFIGSQSAEVLGDYGVGPNHTLPTGGTSRWNAGLNVFTFLRVRTWLNLDSPPEALIQDTVKLAEHEGLVGHAASARRRLSGTGN